MVERPASANDNEAPPEEGGSVVPLHRAAACAHEWAVAEELGGSRFFVCLRCGDEG